MSKPVPSIDRKAKWLADNAALTQRGSLLILLDPEMEQLGALSGPRGRPATFPDAAAPRPA